MFSKTDNKIEKRFFFTQRCVKCSKEYDPSHHVTSCECGGLVGFDYDLASISSWAGLVQTETNGNGKKGRALGKYSGLLPLVNPSEAIFESGIYSPGSTPLYRSEGLGSAIGLRNLWLKDESKNPTLTFKDRDAAVTISRFQEIGVSDFVVCSTGNTAAALLHAMQFARKPMRMHLFLPEATVADFPIHSPSIAKLEFVPDSYQAAIKRAEEYSRSTRIPFEGGFRNPSRLEGNKTLAFEIVESGLALDWYVQAVASGTGTCGLYRAYSQAIALGAAKRCPRILVVQPENCAPLVNAFADGAEEMSSRYIVDQPDTFAKTLANGDPWFCYPYVRKTVLDSRGLMEKVSETEMGVAQVQLFKHEGLIVDPAVAVAYAGLAKCVRLGKLDKDANVLLNITGGVRRLQRA